MKGGKREGAGRKPGSPNKEKKVGKSSVIRVRVTDEEKATINDCLKVTGKTESDFIRDAIAHEIDSVRLCFAVAHGITGKGTKKTR